MDSKTGLSRDKKMKKLISVFLLGASFIAYALEPIRTGDSLKDSADLANRRTALRCLSNATGYVSDGNYEAALSQARLGIAYDDSISDLWYMVAACGTASGQTRYEILPVLEKSLKKDNWVNYNRDNARLMAADILCETNRLKEALGLLDAKPVLYSSDAEFIRVKTYYRLGDSASVSKARNKIDGARRIYPSDTRFPLAFFRNEKPGELDASSKRIADYFISQIAQYQEASPDKDAELEIYGASFAEGEVKKRLLKSFSARGLKHPLYASEALKAGLVNQQQAFDYICNFADDQIDVDLFRNFLSLVTEKNVIGYAAKYLESFDGTFLQDTDGDGNTNIVVKYMRGRPEKIICDLNQDGNIEWTINCDFGVPVDGSLSEKNMKFSWSQFPYLSSVQFDSGDGKSSGEKFIFAGETLLWTPLEMLRDNVLSDKTGIDFFYPVLNARTCNISNSQLLDAASSFEIDTSGKNGERIHFVLLHGNVQQSMYYKDDVLYAQAQFEANIPVLRVVDSDRDGVFETTEFYDVDLDGTMEVHSLQDERVIMQSLYGIPSEGAEFYLRMVQVDTNADTVPDFTEEYLAHGGKITSWDTDSSGTWNVRHVVYPVEKKDDGSVSADEDSMFYLSPKNELVTVSTRNGSPVKVKSGSEELNIVKGSTDSFYWLAKNEKDFNGKKYSSIEKKAVAVLEEKGGQGFSVIVEGYGSRVLCVRIGNVNYGVLVEAELPQPEEKEKNEN